MELPLSPDALVEEVVREHPAAVSFLRERGVVCIKCGEPAWGTLAELIGAKGLDVEQVVQALNAHLADQAEGVGRG